VEVLGIPGSPHITSRAHNPKVPSSNLGPATIFSQSYAQFELLVWTCGGKPPSRSLISFALVARVDRDPRDRNTPLLPDPRLSNEKELLLTSDGKPVAVLVNVGPSDDPEVVIQAVRDSRSRLALARVRASARKAGTNTMSTRDIEREIATARRERGIQR
jgi:hypothetical protein